MDISSDHPIAYFCAEYGLSADLPIYAGGLGVLAGDTLKAAADLDTPTVGIGLLYRGQHQTQRISEDGLQIEDDYEYDPVTVGLEHVYLDEMPLFVKVHLTNESEVWLRVWKKTLSEKVVLYLFDSDTDQNEPVERSITHALYTGTAEEQLLKQIILGIGGVKLLAMLNIHPQLYHVNEGRPAFLHWQLIRHYMDDHGLSYDDAKAKAKGMTVYTNHTLVGAGNPGIELDLVKKYAQYYADKMGVPVDQVLKDGLDQESDTFHITQFALNTSRKASGVSQLHFQLSQQYWSGYNWVGITNGVHLPTWQDKQIRECDVSSHEIWLVHQQKKQQTMEFIRQRTGFGYDPYRLVISWARRITGYKQLDSLFNDVERLRGILKNQDRPAQLLIAGKAHPKDSIAKALLQQVIQYMQRELSGLALFVPNYDLDVARALVQGSDIWLNTPEYGKEASGTSGMKAASNGVLQCTVPDGWAAEVSWDEIGWTLNHRNLSQDLYQKLEEEISPLFFLRNSDGIPVEWVERMKKSVQLAQRFSAQRMWREYLDLLYPE